MKITCAVVLLVLQAAFVALSPQLCSAQNPLAALENEAKEKAAEAALTKVLNDNLPLTLDAKDVYPTLTTLPGGPFSPTPLQLTADQLDQPLAPGDYTINTLDFCSQYSVHQPGAGLAYVLGPYEGKAAGAIGALIWRGTEQYQINPNSLQAVSWAIQSGLTYEQMPKSYQAIVDQVIPDFKSQITGDFVTNLENTYNSLAKAASLPPLDTMLSKLGAPGQLALDAERQRQILTAQNTSDELKQQTLFQGQESGIYTPVKAENGPWTERVTGQVYMKLLIAGGNMATNNVMEIRVMPSPTANARLQVGRPRLVRAAYGAAQVTPAANDTPITVANLMEGILGYAMGQGAQALGQVAQLLKPLNPFTVTPAEAAEGAQPAQPTPTQPAPAPAPAPTASQPTTSQGGASTAAQNSSIPGSNFLFASCSSAISSKQLYQAYSSLYSDSQLFKDRMNAIQNKVNVLVLDGLSSQGASYQTLSNCAYTKIIKDHPNTKLNFPPTGDFAYTYIPSGQASGTILVVITAQNLLYNAYLAGSAKDACKDTASSQLEPVFLEQVMSYELAQNANGLAGNLNYQEKPDESDTNTIMEQLAAAMAKSGNPKFSSLTFMDNVMTDLDAPNKCQIMSGAAQYLKSRDQAYNQQHKGGIFDFSLQGQLIGIAQNPPNPDVYDGTGKVLGTLPCASFTNPIAGAKCPVGK